MIVDGEKVTESEVRRLIKLWNDECRKIAGEFFDKCRSGSFGDPGRSAKFRAFWDEVGFRCGRPAAECYAETHYLNFSEEVRRIYAELMARPDVRERDKRDMHRANIIQNMLGQFSQEIPFQIAKDSQLFWGDRYENKEISKTYGDHAEPSLVSKLLNSTAL